MNSQGTLLDNVELPSASRFARVPLPKSHAVVSALRDLRDMYFIFDVGEDRVSRQAWGPRVPSSWFSDLDDASCDDSTDIADDWWTPDLIGSKTARIFGGDNPILRTERTAIHRLLLFSHWLAFC